MKRCLTATLAIVLVMTTAIACSDDDTSAPNQNGSGPRPANNTDSIVIYGSRPVERLVSDLVAEFEVVNPGISVVTTFADTPSLIARVDAGEPVDLLLDEASVLRSLGPDAGIVGEPILVGSDLLQAIVPAGPPPESPRTLTAFGPDPQSRSGLCEDDVVCGELAAAVLDDAKIDPAPDLVTPSGQVLVESVANGEADIALAMRSEARSRFHRVKNAYVTLPEGVDVKVPYHVAQLREGLSAEAFLAFLASDRGIEAITRRGFRGFFE